MVRQNGLKRANVYVDPDKLDRVARELGCRPSEVVRRLIDNYLLATDIDAIRKLPGPGPQQVFRQGPDYELPEIRDDVEIEPVD